MGTDEGLGSGNVTGRICSDYCFKCDCLYKELYINVNRRWIVSLADNKEKACSSRLVLIPTTCPCDTIAIHLLHPVHSLPPKSRGSGHGTEGIEIVNW